METKEQPERQAQGKSKETQILALVVRPDGKLQVKAFTREAPLEPNFQLNGAVEFSSKEFDVIPKGIAELLMRNFQPQSKHKPKQNEADN